jgi:hypothetical protein
MTYDRLFLTFGLLLRWPLVGGGTPWGVTLAKSNDCNT